jgi:hypothetical protein
MQYITQRYDGKGNLISETRVDLTPEDIAREWEGIRQERNRLLGESDWTRLDDATADKDAWATYRQALRDITLQHNPLEVQWPVEPS